MRDVQIQCFASSERGLRDQQEDCFWAGPHLFIVADGMGGHLGGALAAQTAVEAIVQECGVMSVVDQSALEDAINWAASEVSLTTGQGGTTVVVAHISPDLTTHIAWVGDSSIFWLDAHDIECLTTAHTDGSGGLTRWIPDEPSPQCLQFSLHPGEHLILCSDGITDVLDGQSIAQIVRDAEDDVAQWLVEEALAAGSADNCTAVVCVVG